MKSTVLIAVELSEITEYFSVSPDPKFAIMNILQILNSFRFLRIRYSLFWVLLGFFGSDTRYTEY